MQKTTHRIRSATADRQTVVVDLNRGKAIKCMCTECMGFDGNPKECTDTNCSLYPWRGKSLLAWGRKQVIV